MKTSADVPVLISPDIEKWFTTVHEQLSQTEVLDVSALNCRSPFIAIERDCSSLDRKLKSLEHDLENAFRTVSKLEEVAARCNFATSATTLTVATISTAKQPPSSSFGLFSTVLGYIHAVSNWLFAFFEG
jgi:hypothetical protein